MFNKKDIRLNLKFIVLFLTSPSYLLASSAEAGVPWATLQAQAVNFTLFIAIMIFALRKPAAAHFAKFRSDFLDESTKAQKVVAAAEKQKKEIEDQITKLETTYSSRLETSRKEAVQMKTAMINEATEKSKKSVEDTKESANQLFKSAEQSIRAKVLDSAIVMAKEDLVKKIDTKESERLHGEFLEEITAGYL